MPERDADPRPRQRQRRATDAHPGDQTRLPDTCAISESAVVGNGQRSGSGQLADELAELCTFRTAGSGRLMHVIDRRSLERVSTPVHRMLMGCDPARMFGHYWRCRRVTGEAAAERGRNNAAGRVASGVRLAYSADRETTSCSTVLLPNSAGPCRSSALVQLSCKPCSA